MDEDQRFAFRNNTQGWLNALRKDHTGVYRSVPVAPETIVTLTREEQRLTAESHAEPRDNPFIDHEIKHFDPHTADVIRTFRAPLLELQASYEGTERPIGVEDAPVGSADSREEGGTPDAQPRGRRKPAAKRAPANR